MEKVTSEEIEGPMSVFRFDPQLSNMKCENCADDIKKEGFGLFFGRPDQERKSLRICVPCRRRLTILLIRDHIRCRIRRGLAGIEPLLLAEVTPDATHPAEEKKK